MNQATESKTVDQIYKGVKFLQWYKDPCSFFKDIFGDEPYFYQANVLNELKNINAVGSNRLKRLLLEAAGGTGKSKLLACIALWLAVVLPKFIGRPYTVIIISGSEDQSKSLYEHSKYALDDNVVLNSETEGEPLQSIVHFKDRSRIRAVPNSLKAIQGKHEDCVIVDEGALAGDFVIDDTYRIIGSSTMDLIILSGTPMIFGSKFVELAENVDKYPEWKRYRWNAMDCPRTKDKYEEAKKALPEDMFCYDKETEVLTINGWKKYNELTKETSICTLNQTTNNIEYQNPTNIFINNYYGKMYTLETRTLNLKTTLNHKMYVRRKNGPYRFREAKEVYNRNFLFKKSGIWNGEPKEYFVLPESIKKLNAHKTIKIPSKKLPMNEWLKFFGFWLAEGCTISTSNNLVVVTNFDKEVLLRIQEICHRLGFKATPNGNNLRIYSVQLYDYLKQFGKAHEKYIPLEIKQLSKESLVILYNYMMLGDGSKLRANNKSYGTNSMFLANDFQELLLKIGICGSISFYDPEVGKRFYRISVLEHSNETAINYSRKHKTKESFDDYNNIVWCVEVPNHIVYVRRNGKCVWSGNSVFWEGKSFSGLGVLIPPSELKIAVKDIQKFFIDKDIEVVAGVDWGFRHYTALVIAQKGKDGIVRILYVDAWRREDYEDMQTKIDVICKDYGVYRIYCDNEDIGENQRLGDKGFEIIPIPFNKWKVQMQSHIKVLFHNEQIKIPEEYTELVTELRKYNWTTKENDDRVDALQLACWGTRQEDESFYFEIL